MKDKEREKKEMETRRKVCRKRERSIKLIKRVKYREKSVKLGESEKE